MAFARVAPARGDGGAAAGGVLEARQPLHAAPAMNLRALQDGSGSQDGSLAGPAPLGPDAGDAVDAAMALADELAGTLGPIMAAMIDVWPHICTGLSLLGALYVAASSLLHNVSRATRPAGAGRARARRHAPDAA